MRKSPLRVFVGVLTMALLGISMTKGYQARQVSSAKALTSENWGLGFSTEGEAPTANETPDELKKWDTYYIGNQEKKKIYLTFDCGYENGQMECILDALKEADVKACFFLVGNYLETEPELVKRMVEEGHTIGNHTYHHKDMTRIDDFDAFREELESLEALYRETTGKELSKYYRPPEGKFDERSLRYASELGYRTIFWSVAYADWDNKNQPSAQTAKAKILERVHNGAVILLHPTSRTNAEILKDVIVELKGQGYRFGSLDELTAQRTGDG